MALSEQDASTLGIILEGIFYGAYTVLFILYLVLRRRNNHMIDGPLTLAQILLFCICTISMCLDILEDYFFVVPDMANANTARKIEASSMVIFAIIDCLAQMILLYRCWIIWDRRWVIVAFPGFLSLITLGVGFALVALDVSPLWSFDVKRIAQPFKPIATTTFTTSLCVNALTTSLILIKILLISREVHQAGLNSDSHRSLRMITSMLIESGLLIFAFQLVLVVLFSIQTPALNIFCGPVTLIYGITPTLLGIRVVMGSAYDKTTEKTRSLRFAHTRGAATQTTGLSMSVAGVQSRVIDIGLDEIPNERADAAV